MVDELIGLVAAVADCAVTKQPSPVAKNWSLAEPPMMTVVAG